MNAIKAGGTTIRSYTSSLNVTGRFQVNLNAYGKAGEPCSRCGKTLERIVVSGRSTVFCGKCQKVRR
ncbi:zinc finger domain-containing protein [Erysipelothrix piscisicarius]